MSSASPPRTSPTTMRSGRIRRALRNSVRVSIAPTPSTLAALVSSPTTFGCGSLSSAASSMVTMRSSAPIANARAFSVVVLPLDVPPDTRTLRRSRTAPTRYAIASAEAVPLRTRSSGSNGRAANRRIVRTGPWIAIGGITACTRDPSGSRASTSGCARSIRRPSGATSRSMRTRISSASRKRIGVDSTRPSRSIHTPRVPFTMTSLTRSSRSNGAIAPRPKNRSSKYRSSSRSSAVDSARRSVAAVSRSSPPS